MFKPVFDRKTQLQNQIRQAQADLAAGRGVGQPLRFLAPITDRLLRAERELAVLMERRAQVKG